MANLLQKASIVLTPTAYDNGKVLCAKPSEAPYGDFDFSRNSAATRVNAQGLVENVQILSSNLVQNGDFSEEGAEEVSNGSFSQEGSEEITNGDFSNGSTDWDFVSTSELTEQGARIYTPDGSYTIVVQNNVLVVGKPYKVTFDVIATDGSSLSNGSGSVVYDTSTIGSKVFYITTDEAGFALKRISGITDVTITNISVKEVAQDWTLGTGWSIGEDKAICDGTNSPIDQYSVTTIGKTYKVDITVADMTTASVNIRLGTSSSDIIGTISANGTYTFYGTVASNTTFRIRSSDGFDGSITNISVKEVLQDWSVEDYGAVSPSAVITPNTEGVKLEKTVSADWRSSFLVQPISYTNGSQYKVTFKLKNGNLPSGGSVFVRRAYDSSSQNIASTLTLTNDWVEYTYYFVADSNSEDISFGEVNWQNAGVGQYFYIDDVSVIEITDDTNLPRINYEGFSYQDALGSELISNGDFSNGSTDWGSYATGSSTIVFTDVATLNIDASNSNVGIYQENVFTSGKQYKIVLKMKATASFDAEILETQQASTVSTIGSVSLTTSFQDFTFYFTATGSNDIFVHRKFNEASANQSIIIDNVSVKEYLGQEVVPNSGCGSWLFESQSTNLLLQSNQFDTTWAKSSGVTITSGQTISPQGTNNGWKFEKIAAAYKSIGQSYTSSTETTFSIFAKKGTLNIITLFANISGATNLYQRFDLENGIVSTGSGMSSSNIKDYGNGWYRCSSTFTNTNVISLDYFPDFGETEAGYIYIYGAQSEAGNISSYIPTEGSQVTRNQDVCNNGGSLATINSTEGVLYAEIAALANDGTIREISINNGSIFNRVSIYYTASVIYAKWQGANGGIDLFHIIPEVTDFHKVAIKYKSGDTALWVDGLEVDTSSSVNSTSGLNVLDFDRADGANNFYGKTKAVAVWKEALSDEELAELTYPTPTDPTFTLDFDTIAEQFTFARGSEATYVDAQGLIQSTNEIGEELVVNGDFATDSDWNKVNATISDGKGNLDSTSGTSLLFQSALVVGKSYKATLEVSNYNGLGICALINSSGATQFAITSDGNKDFYFTHGGTNANLSFRATNGGIFSIDNVSVKEVTTATNTPRLDYSTGAEAFLLEPQRTNLVVNSSLGSPKTPYDGATNYLAPDGASSAFTPLVSTSSNRFESVINGGNYVSGTELTYSWYRKRISTPLDPSFLGDLDVKSFVNATFSSTTQIASDISGYDRFSVKVTITDGSLESKIRAYYGSLIGVGNSSVAYWGHQLELGSYATSYIPTSGTTVTRNQETCINATPEINSEEGVLYAEISALADDGTYRLISLNDGSSANIVQMYYAPAANRISAEIKVGNVAQAGFNYTVSDTTDIHKIAFKYKENDFALWIDGVEVGTDASGAVLTAGTLTELDFSIGSGSFPFYGNTKDIQVYTKALSDAELIKLTT